MNIFKSLLECFKEKDNISLDPISYPDPNPSLKEIEIVKQYYPNRNLRRQYSLVGNSKEGTCLEWHPNGLLSYRYSFKNNKKHGSYYGWWKNGSLGLSKHYRDGILDGLQCYYTEDGEFAYLQKYVNGSMVYRSYIEVDNS